VKNEVGDFRKSYYETASRKPGLRRRSAVKYKTDISGLTLLEHYLGMDIKKVKWYISQGRGRQILRIIGLLYLKYIKERNRYVEKMSYLEERRYLSKKKHDHNNPEEKVYKEKKHDKI
jgi:hypothetical protein